MPAMGVVCTRAFYGVWAVADSNMRTIGTVYRVQRSIFMLPVNLYVGRAVRVKTGCDTHSHIGRGRTRYRGGKHRDIIHDGTGGWTWSGSSGY